MKDFTFNEIMASVADFKPESVVLSDSFGRISVRVENLGETPRVSFIVELFPSREQRQVTSFKEALALLGIEGHKRVFKCAVFAPNANGEADIFYVKVRCSSEDYDRGRHYEAARKAATDAGYEVGEATMVADENDPACHPLLNLITWNTVPVVSL